MRILAPILAIVTVAAIVTGSSVSAAGETIVIEEAAPSALPQGPGGCACGSTSAPPWHASVAGDPCDPICPPPNMFHANPCGQLWLKHTARTQGYAPPSCFPRMNTRLTEGYWPTPRPISLPRCPRCGAHIEGGF